MTDADREAERVITELLRVERREDALLGEEGDAFEGRSGRRWVVDPLDGTVNFFYGIPQWAVSVALEDDEGGIVGVVRDPLRSETFKAMREGGALLNGGAMHVRRPEELSKAMIATGFAYAAELRARQAETLTRVLPRVRDVRRAGAAALDLSWVAAGRLDGYYERGLKPWDWAAGRLLVTEAGGDTARLVGDPPGLAAAAPALLPQLVELVSD